MTGSIGGQEKGLGDILEGLEGGVRKVDACQFIEPVGRGFGLSPEPL